MQVCICWLWRCAWQHGIYLLSILWTLLVYPVGGVKIFVVIRQFRCCNSQSLFGHWCLYCGNFRGLLLFVASCPFCFLSHQHLCDYLSLYCSCRTVLNLAVADFMALLIILALAVFLHIVVASCYKYNAWDFQNFSSTSLKLDSGMAMFVFVAGGLVCCLVWLLKLRWYQ